MIAASSLHAVGQPTVAPTPTPPAPVPPVEILEHWRRATVSIGQIVDDGKTKKYVTIGSAIIIATDEHHGCILTAKHVFYDPDRGYIPTTTRVRPPTNNSSPSPDYGVALPLTVNGQNTWHSLSDGSDLAVAPLPDLSIYSDLHGVATKDFGGADDVFQGASLIVLGYPAIAGEDRLIFPIARSGMIAWVDPNDKLSRTFLVDANFFSGNSGGPVFRFRSGTDRFGNLNLGGGLVLVGVVSKDGVENAPVKVGDQPVRAVDPTTGQPAPVYAQVLNIGGIGIIEPVSRALRLAQQYCAPTN